MGRVLKKVDWLLLVIMIFIMCNLCACSNKVGKVDNDSESVAAAEETIAVIGHRGYPAVKPENTLSSFLAAKDIGDDYIELDVQESSDGEIVVFHDNTLARITGAEGAIADYTLSELQAMDAGSFFSASCAGEQIPTLRDALKLVKGEFPGYKSIRSTAKGDMKVYLELKDIGPNEEFVSKVVDIVNEEGMSDRVIYASFQYDYLSQIKNIDNNNLTLLNTSVWKESYITDYSADYYGLYMEIVNQGIVRQIHDADRKAFVWTVDTPEAVRNVIRMGADGVVTNDSGMAIVAVNTRFDSFFDKYESALHLPFLYYGDSDDANYVVQGFTNARGNLLISAYDKTGSKNSVVYVMNRAGSLIRKVDMGTMAHVGGLAYDEDNDLLWITGPDGRVMAASWNEVSDGSFSGGYVSDFDAELVNHNGGKVASFIGMYDGFLYVGSYTIGMSGILRKYDVSEPVNPVLVYEAEIPECIQGVTVYHDVVDDAEYMILSQSRETNDAHLLTFKYDEKLKGYDKPIFSELLPEGTENIQMTAEGLYVLFESGSKPYRETAIVPNDKLYLIRR